MPPEPTPQPRILRHEVVPPGGKWFGTIRRGTTLRLVAPEGSQGVSCLFYSADDRSERYNAADTVKIQFGIRLGAGRLLYSDMGRVLMSITADTCGRHDPLIGASTPADTEARFGPGHPSAREHFIQALGRLGMDKRDLMPGLNLFSALDVTADGRLVHTPGAARPGDHIDLRAEMNVLVILANTPHALHPGPTWAPLPLEVVQLDGPPAAADDPCRTGCPEAVRAFINTDECFL